MSTLRVNRFLLFLAVVCLCSPATAGEYVKHGPDPPDANKESPGIDLSCWLATAANMLAGADYGTGATEQDQADEIYDNELRPNLSGMG
ncbi:MAG: hypothetical protein JSU86_04825 [Phycisphaerales bacterium]|nr:MAG: hypothetical protein JSU86_04825 [Phycisphaerales bacterium]